MWKKLITIVLSASLISSLPTIASANEVLEQIKETGVIKAGYRHFDFAHVYGNEKEIGAALRQAFDQGLVTGEVLTPFHGSIFNIQHQLGYDWSTTI